MALTATLGVVVGSTAASINQANKAEAAQRESRAVSTATQKIQDRNMLKQKQRELMIRSAQIKQAATSSGVSASSGEIGALGGLQTMYSGLMAQITGQQKAADAITNLNDKAAAYQQRSRNYAAVSNLASQSFSLFNS